MEKRIKLSTFAGPNSADDNTGRVSVRETFGKHDFVFPISLNSDLTCMKRSWPI